MMSIYLPHPEPETEAGRNLAQTLWGMERYNVHSASNPAPLHNRLAYRLEQNQSFREALREALDAIDKEIN